MPGTRTGGLKTAETNKLKYGEDFYRKIGTLGGAKSRGGGFAYDRELASRAGRIGGKASRRPKQEIVYRKPNSHKLLEYYAEDGFRAAPNYNHNVIGYIVRFKKL